MKKIDTSPSSAPSHLDQRTAIVVSYWGCFLGGETGAHLRVNRLLEYLADHHDKLIFYSRSPGGRSEDAWTDANIEAFQRRFPGVELVLDAPGTTARIATMVKNRLLSLLPGSARYIAGFEVPGIDPNFRALKTRHPDARFLVNYADGIAQLNGVPVDRVTVETHDIQSVKWRKTNAKQSSDLSVMLRMRQEIGALNVVAGVVAITKHEANFFESMLNGPRIFSIPIYGEEHLRVKPLPKPDAFAHDFLFAASDNRFNVRGLINFANQNQSWLASYKVGVCGRICDVPEIAALADQYSFIDRLGFVPDLAPVYAGARACLSPVDGTGLKIKILEALYYGKPVFASPHSMDGLAAGFDECVFPLDRAAMQRLVSEDAALEAAEQAAIEYVAQFARTSQADALLEFLGCEEPSQAASGNVLEAAQ